MVQKGSGIERFLAPSLSKLEDEIGSIHAEIEKVKARMDETDNRLAKLEEEYKRLEARTEKADDGMTTQSKVLFESVNEMERQDREEIEVLKRAIDVAQRRIVVLEAKMKELGQ